MYSRSYFDNLTRFSKMSRDINDGLMVFFRPVSPLMY